MPRKGENIYKRKDGRWEGRFIKSHDLCGKAQYGYVYGKSYSDTRRMLKEKQSHIIHDCKESSNANIQFAFIINSWLESMRFQVKESTFARYYQVVNTHLLPKIGAVKVDRITTTIIEDFVTHLYDNGRLNGKGGLSSKTTYDILTITKSIIDYGIAHEYPIKCNLEKLCIKQKTEEMRVLTVEEQQKLTNVLINNIDSVKFGVLLSLYTGIRVGEVCALKWSNVNTDFGVLSIHNTMQRIIDTSVDRRSMTKIVITKPKSDRSIRDIPLPLFILDIARELKKEADSFVLTGEKDRYIEPRTMQNHFKSLIKESNIKDANYHSLRHTFATRCVELGFEIKTLSEILGHSNVNITLNRYVHSSYSLKQENMQKIKCIS